MRLSYIIVILCSIALPFHATARIGSIPNATVTQGKKMITWRTAYTLDNESTTQDKRTRSRITLDYGVTDWYAAWIALEGQNLQQQSPELTRLMWDQRIELTTTQEEGFYSGVRLRYEHWAVQGRTDSVHIRFIAGKEIAGWDFRLNHIIGMEVGSTRKAGAIWDTRWHLSHRYHPHHSVGMEAFHVLGNLSERLPYAQQNHYIGPTFFGALTDELRYEAGYMVGMSRAAPDHSFYLGLTKDF